MSLDKNLSNKIVNQTLQNENELNLNRDMTSVSNIMSNR